MAWLSRRFSTRVIALMPVAIALNIVLGATVQQVLKLPIYLDSIGTILVGVLAGPIAGLVTGVLTNLIWQYAPVVGGGTIGPFAIVGGLIGLLAGVWGHLGVYRPRPATGRSLALAAAAGMFIIAVLAWRIYTSPVYADPDIGGYPPEVYTSVVVIAVLAGLAVGAVVFLRRDAAPAWVAAAGAITGIVAAIASAPISAAVFGGVTGSGTDFLVAALRQGGADVLNAALGQGLISDPLDKTITSFIVFVVLLSLSRRYLARFPLGDRVVEPQPVGQLSGVAPRT